MQVGHVEKHGEIKKKFKYLILLMFNLYLNTFYFFLDIIGILDLNIFCTTSILHI